MADDILPQWLPDPSARHDLRYWDGSKWTAHVSTGGEVAEDLAELDIPDDWYLRNQPVVPLPNSIYLGGNPELGSRMDGIYLCIGATGISVVRKRTELHFWPWHLVEDVAIGDQREVESRVTAGRVLLLGAFAFAVPKKSTFAYVTVSVRGHHDSIFQVSGYGPIQLRAELQTRIGYRGLPSLSQRPPQSEGSPAGDQPAHRLSIAERLQTLSELHAQGLLDSAEYVSQRQRIVDSI